MKKYRNALAFLSIVILSGLLFSFVTIQDKKDGGPWTIPEKFQNMENTYKDDASLIKVGKILYLKHCRSCHGSKGDGDGPKAASLKTKMNPLKDAKVQSQSDGILYFQSFIGRDEMPNYEKKIPSKKDQWAVINYMRTFKK